MTNRLLTLAVIGAVGAGSAASIATAHDGRGKAGFARTQIATVTSYASGTLTLKTSGGAEVTATVTRRTRIACLPLATGTTPTPTPAATTPVETTPTRRGDDDDRDDREGRDRRGERMHRGGDDDDAVCDTSSLTSGTGVIAAATELTASGQKFTKLVLVSTATSSDDDSDS